MEYANKIIICMSANARMGQGRLHTFVYHRHRNVKHQIK